MSYPDFSAYQTSTSDSGNPLLDKLLTLLGGFKGVPEVSTQQDVYDSYLQRERSRQFMYVVQRNAAIGNQLTEFFGVNPNSPIVKSAGLFLGDPNGPYANAIKSITGSNPMLAQSILYGGLTGSTMGAFGRMGNISPGEAGQLNGILNNTIYNQRTISDTYLNNEVQRQVQKAQEAIRTNPGLGQLYGLNSAEQFTKDSSSQFGISADIMVKLQETIAKQNEAKTDEDRKRIARESVASLGVPASIIAEHTDKSGNVDIKAIQDEIINNPVSNAFEMMGGFNRMRGYKIAGSENYERTRGFSQEDLNSAFISAADTQLLGRNSLGSAYQGFLTHGADMLSAARGVFGNKPANQLMGDINSLLGTNAPDTSTEAGAKEVADLLRNTKAVARIAGQSIDSLMGVIKTAQQVASEHPELQLMGGQGVTNIVLDATKHAVLLNGLLSPTDSRAMGGVQGIQSSLVAAGLRGQDSVISKTIAAANYMYGDNQGVQSAISAYNNSTHNRGDYDTLLRSIGSSVNVSPEALASTLNDPRLAKYAFSDKASAAKGKEAYDKAILDDFHNQISMGGPEGWEQLKSIVAKGGGTKDIVSFLMKSGGQYQQAFTTFDRNAEMIRQQLIESTPGGAQRIADINKYVAQSALEDANFDQSHARRYSSVFHQTIQSLIGGEDKDISTTLENLKNTIFDPILAGGPPAPADQAIMKKVNAAEKFFNSGPATFSSTAALFSSTTGKDVSEQFIKDVYSAILNPTAKSSDQVQQFINQNFNDETKQQLQNNPNDLRAFGQSIYRSIGEAERRKTLQPLIDIKEKDIEDNLKALKDNPTAKAILDKYKGNYEQVLEDMQDPAKHMQGIDQSGITAVSDAIRPASEDINSLRQKIDQGYGDSPEDQQENQNETLTKIFNAIKDPNSISKSLDSLVTALTSLK